MEATKTLPINMDCGEIEGDHLLLEPKGQYRISLANISCGQHAGILDTISQAILTSLQYDILIGAHPSYPDRENFGRVSISMTPWELTQSISDQVEFLVSQLPKNKSELNHIKAHGALYHDLLTKESVVESFLEAISWLKYKPCIVTMEGSKLYQFASSRGYRVLKEAFGDRRYVGQNILQSRSIPGALIEQPDEILSQIEDLNQRFILSAEGRLLRIEADTVCVHGDNVGVSKLRDSWT